MARATKALTRIKKQIRRVMNRYGTTAVWVRPGWIDTAGVGHLEQTREVYCMPIPIQLIRSLPGWDNVGGVTISGADSQQVLFDGYTDVKEGDILTYHSMKYRVARFDPLDPVDISALGVAECHRMDTV